MNKTNIIFWLAMALIAAFYVFKGNDMHKEKIQITKDNRSVTINK